MAITLFLFTGKELKNGRSPILLRIIHERKTKYVATEFSASPEEWDGSTQLTNVYKKNHKLTQPEFEKINSALLRKLNEAQDIYWEMLKNGKPLNLDILKSKIKKSEKLITFDQLTERIIKENKTAGRIGNAINYNTMLNVLRDYYGKNEIRFDTITFAWLKGLETWHLEKENTINSLSVYLRACRAIFNRGIKENLVESNLYPFGRGKYEISSSPTRKRAIGKDSFTAIEKLDLPENSSLWHTKNYFLFSFYMRGMNFIDLAYLKVKNIVNGRIEYLRIKTIRKNAKSFSILIVPKAQQILDFYIHGKESDDFVFPIIFRHDSPERVRADIANARKNFNKYLNKIGEMIGLESHITSYTTRHSWATIGKRMGVNYEKISDGLGHADVSTTRAYLDSIEDEEIDKANLLITA